MASTSLVMAKSHASTQEEVCIASDDTSFAATLHFPWHARAVVMLLHTGDAGMEQINAAVTHHLQEL